MRRCVACTEAHGSLASAMVGAFEDPILIDCASGWIRVIAVFRFPATYSGLKAHVIERLRLSLWMMQRRATRSWQHERRFFVRRGRRHRNGWWKRSRRWQWWWRHAWTKPDDATFAGHFATGFLGRSCYSLCLGFNIGCSERRSGILVVIVFKCATCNRKSFRSAGARKNEVKPNLSS